MWLIKPFKIYFFIKFYRSIFTLISYITNIAYLLLVVPTGFSPWSLLSLMPLGLSTCMSIIRWAESLPLLSTTVSFSCNTFWDRQSITSMLNRNGGGNKLFLFCFLELTAKKTLSLVWDAPLWFKKPQNTNFYIGITKILICWIEMYNN